MLTTKAALLYEGCLFLCYSFSHQEVITFNISYQDSI